MTDNEHKLRSELDLHKEELEAQNDELIAINATLQAANRALELARDDYRILFELGPLPCITFDHQCRLKQWNPPAARVFHLTGGNDGARLDAYLAPDSLPAFRTFLATVVAESRATSGELELLIAGTPLLVVLEAVVMPDDASGARRILCTIVDVTARRIAEAAQRALDLRLQHIQQLESLRVLAGGVAHDFNNLLMVIIGNLELARGELSPDAPPQAYLDEALMGANHAANLSKQMLAFGGKGPTSRRPLDLVALLHEVEPLARAAAQATIVELEVGDQSVVVEGDATQLCQIVLNLVTNAAEAGAGQVNVSVAIQDMTAADVDHLGLDYPMPAGRYVVLEVRDTGPGIAPETLRRILEPFFSTKFVGRGLGLSVVQGIARAHHGGVTVQSVLGAGTTFCVFLPHSTRTVAPPPRLPRVGGSTRRVLVIDDDLAVARTVARICATAGMTVTTARSGAEALELVKTRTFDVALIDLVMPGMGGVACATHLRELAPKLVLILTTGFGDVPAESAAVFDATLTKPYKRDEIIAQIAKLVPPS